MEFLKGSDIKVCIKGNLNLKKKSIHEKFLKKNRSDVKFNLLSEVLYIYIQPMVAALKCDSVPWQSLEKPRKWSA